MAMLAFAVSAIDGVPLPQPANEHQIEAAIDRLGDPALDSHRRLPQPRGHRRLGHRHPGKLSEHPDLVDSLYLVHHGVPLRRRLLPQLRTGATTLGRHHSARSAVATIRLAQPPLGSARTSEPANMDDLRSPNHASSDCHASPTRSGEPSSARSAIHSNQAGPTIGSTTIKPLFRTSSGSEQIAWQYRLAANAGSKPLESRPSLEDSTKPQSSACRAGATSENSGPASANSATIGPGKRSIPPPRPTAKRSISLPS